MQDSVNIKIVESSKKLLHSIHHLKSATNDSTTLLQKISFLTQSFDELIEILHINNLSIPDTVKFVPKNKESGDLTEHKYMHGNLNYTILVHKVHGILKIDTGSVFLNPLCMKHVRKFSPEDHIIKLEEFLKLYWDIDTRKCDRCKMYFNFDTGEVPIVRNVEMNYVSAYHESCFTT